MTTRELRIQLGELHDKYSELSRNLSNELPEFQRVARDADYVFSDTNQHTLQNILNLLRRCEDQIDDMVKNLQRTIVDLEDYEIGYV